MDTEGTGGGKVFLLIEPSFLVSLLASSWAQKQACLQPEAVFSAVHIHNDQLHPGQLNT